MSNLTGTDKSVILLMTIGEDRAAEVFKHLSQREVQTLSAAMANVTQISNKQLTDVLAEFEQEAEQFHDFHSFFDYRPGDCQRVDGIGDDDGPPRHHCSAL